jgi:hypothetical protein
MIRYEDGSKDMFNEASNTNNTNNSNSSDMYSRGKEDAIMNYRGKNSGAGGTGFAVALTSPLIGLIPAIACSSTEPSDENLKYTNRELMRNADYNRGYREQAHKTKRRKIWTAFGIGSAAWLLLVILLGSGG